MKRLNWCTLFVGFAVVMLVFSSTAYAQERGGRGNREEMMRRARERRVEMIKQFLQKVGASDDEQAAILETMEKKEEARRDLMRATMDLAQAVRSPNATDDQVSIALSAYEDAEAAFKEKAASLDKSLDGKVKYSAKPKLKAVLIVLGVLGERPMMMGGFGRGRGGPGGRPGGPERGRGGGRR